MDQVYKFKDGILKATSCGDLPSGLQQVYDLGRANRKELSICPVYSSCSTHDMLFTVMQHCKRKVQCLCGMLHVRLNRWQLLWQLLDFEQFLTNLYHVCVLGIDPTFKLDDFSVTPTVYQQVIVQHIRSHTSPIMAGPMLIHLSKLFRSDNHFLWG